MKSNLSAVFSLGFMLSTWEKLCVFIFHFVEYISFQGLKVGLQIEFLSTFWDLDVFEGSVNFDFFIAYKINQSWIL